MHILGQSVYILWHHLKIKKLYFWRSPKKKVVQKETRPVGGFIYPVETYARKIAPSPQY